jgi:uncharacterized protein YkwD
MATVGSGESSLHFEVGLVRPKELLMRRHLVLRGLLFLSLIVAPLFGGVKLAAADPLAVDSNSIFGAVFNQTNAYRQANGVHKLILSGRVKPVAQEYAEYLAANNASGHEADGRTPAQRVAAHGIEYCGVAENVYEIWSSPAVPTWDLAVSSAMDFWLRSPGHEANLRDANMKLLGVGSAGWSHEGKNYVKIVQVFVDDCLPADRKIKLRAQ